MDNKRVFITVALLIVIVAIVHAQLTFTPAWGKRNSLGSVSNGGENGGLGTGNGIPSGFNGGSQSGSSLDCHSNADALMLIHHLVQLEAQKLIECHSKDANAY